MNEFLILLCLRMQLLLYLLNCLCLDPGVVSLLPFPFLSPFPKMVPKWTLAAYRGQPTTPTDKGISLFSTANSIFSCTMRRSSDTNRSSNVEV